MTTYYSLTEALKDADKVKILDLSSQQLTDLPAEFGQLIQLQVLNLYQNRFPLFPDVIPDLTSLRQLHLDNNFG